MADQDIDESPPLDSSPKSSPLKEVGQTGRAWQMAAKPTAVPQPRLPASPPSSSTVTSPTTTPRKRGSVACRRCRRLRSKCVHQSSTPPCQSCRTIGGMVASECCFPKRGDKAPDRLFRRRTQPFNHVVTRPSMPVSSLVNDNVVDEHVATSSVTSATSISMTENHSQSLAQPPISQLGPTTSADVSSKGARASVLPPLEEAVEGCRIFVTSYFQLGFIPKSVFLERLIREPEAVSTFLLSCILCISARFTPKLVERYASPAKATEYFLQVSRQMVPQEMYKPSLDRIQAFFLLAIAQWGNVDKERSSMDMGIAVRMAALLKLHCEESYTLSPNAPAEQIVRSESARRTFWMIQSQENLQSGYKTPAPFPLEDITTLLPCDEKEFAFGVVPNARAAVAGTPPAISDPSLVYAPGRCLFASLIQIHGLWGTVARRACRTDANINKAPPWANGSSYAHTVVDLDKWEESLPPSHCFSVWNLRGWKSESLHLAYLAVTMVIRLSNIVLRRIYLEDMLSALTSDPPEELFPSTPSMAAPDDEGRERPREKYPEAPIGFWNTMASQLFTNVHALHEQIDAYFVMRTPEEGFPQILVFCVYMCGSLASSLWRYPTLCPHLADKAETMAMRSLQVLNVLQPAWPGSGKWQMGLSRIATPLHADPIGGNAVASSSQPSSTAAIGQTLRTPARDDMILATTTQHDTQAGSAFHSLPTGQRVQQGMHVFPNELFDAELTAFLQGDFQFESLDGNWGGAAPTT